MAEGLELALGTAQFGLAYGIAGAAAAVDEPEIARILDIARAAGIIRLDTAPAYGDIEQRLSRLMRGYTFEVVSKIAAVPRDLDGPAARDHVLRSIEATRARLGDRLAGVIFHAAEDARDPNMRAAAEVAVRGSTIVLGASLYDVAGIEEMAAWPAFRMVQVPANALDQRVGGSGVGGVEMTVRSAFLQGLLLMPFAQARVRVPQAATALERWHRWCAEQGLEPLVGAFGIIKGLVPSGFCLVGVDDAPQLEDIIAAWELARPLPAPLLAQSDPAIIDPRTWRRLP